MMKTSWDRIASVVLWTALLYVPGSEAAQVCHTPVRVTSDGFLLPADAVSVCREEVDKLVLGFFNGVANSHSQAQDSINTLKNNLGGQFGRAVINYQIFYNQTGCRSGIPGRMGCLEDLAEVFAQRQSEFDAHLRNRWEFFWEALNGSYAADQSWTAQFVRALGNAGQATFDLIAAAAAAVEGRLVAAVAAWIADPPTTDDHHQHAAKLSALVADGAGAVLVAHSQGNLFANSAFEAVTRRLPHARIRLAHVAPASAFVRGEYVLGNSDLVIGALRVATHGRVPANNIAVTASTADPSGHRFIQTYLDATRAAHRAVLDIVRRAMTAVA